MSLNKLENSGNALFEILHHGAVNGVTGSCHQLKLAGKHLDSDSSSYSVLIDCGLFQGDEKEGSSALDDDSSELAQKQIDFSLEGIGALVVTHCHIDHVGRIPYLLAAGFNGPIYTTQATAHLLPLVIEDALKVGVTRNQRLIRSVLNKLKALIKPMPYDQWFDLDGMSNCKARFQVAGHILGSAYVEFDILDASHVKNKGSHRVVFSGDLGAPHSPLLSEPKSPVRADTLVIESTYGDKLHESREHRRQRLKQAIERSFEDGGTVLIPAFSIGRTQELLYEIEEIIHVIESAKKLNKLDENTVSKGATVWDHLDIIVDSPLAAKFTQSYRELKDLWDAEAREKVHSGRHPLAFESMLTIDSHQSHLDTVEYLRKTGRPAVVIAASGMCAGGRMQNYLKALLPDKRTDVIFVGYQAKGTPGRDIQRYGANVAGKPNGYVVLDGERITINAQVHTLSGYSAHADQQDLLNFATGIDQAPQHIRIVHGDDQAKQALQKLYREYLPDCDVVIGVGEE